MSSRVALVVLLAAHAAGFAAQEPPLTVVSAAPRGEVALIDDASEIRLTFSEPMVAIGEPETRLPDWIRIEPAVTLAAAWSGTRTLILTPDPDSPPPFGTTYRVRADATARSLSGRALARDFELTFTTPTARLIEVDGYREEDLASRPLVIRLVFNQPMDPAEVLEHLRVSLEPHPPDVLTLTPAEREQWAREDAANLARFDARVAAARAVAASRARVDVALATDWDRERFPDDPLSVVLRTVTPPAPGSWLRVQLDARLTGREGTVPHPAQSSVFPMEPVLFPRRPRCERDCDPVNQWQSSPLMTRGLHLEEWHSRLTVTDVVDGREVVLTPGPLPRATYRSDEGSPAITVDRLGYPPQAPASTRVYRLSADTTSADGQVLGFQSRMAVTTGHARPYTLIDGSVWESGGGTALPLLTRNALRVSEYLLPLLPADIMPRLVAANTRSGISVAALPPVAPRDRTLPSAPNQNDAHAFDLSAALGAGGTGLVWAAARPTEFLPGVRDTTGAFPSSLVQVTNLALSVKDSPVSTLAWVTTLDAATPVADARVVIRNVRNEVLWTGTTNTDGIAIAPALPLRRPDRSWDLSYIVTAEKAGDVTWVSSSWTTNGTAGARYYFTGTRARLRGSVFTDRGVYMLGDEVRLKAILRHDTPEGIGPVPAGTTVNVSVRDGRGQTVTRAELVVSDWSSVEWRWRIPSTGGLGTYYADIAETGEGPRDTTSASFLVAAFRRPDFSVAVTLEAPEPVLGSALSGDVDARFLFGAALGPQPVRWTIRKSPAHEVPAAIRDRFPLDRHAFGYQWRWDRDAPWDNAVAERTTSLPADGPLTLSQETMAGPDHATSFQLEASVEGVSGQHIANRASMVLHPSSVYVGIVRPPFLVDAAKPLAVEFFATDLSGVARANVPVTVTLLREEWRPERTEVAMGDWPLLTTNGRATLPVPISESGSYILRAVGRDGAGRATRTEVSFYAYGRGRGVWRAEGNRVALIPERQTWQPGERARLLVQTPWERATALVTMERDGISRHERVDITAIDNTITVPITAADIPNVFVSVLLLKGRTEAEGLPHEDPGKPAYRIGYAELKVDHGSRRLAVDVTADRADYQPRDTVQVGVRVTDAAGLARRGEVTVWAMDEGLLALTGYTPPDVARAVYADKALQVQTVETRTRLIDRRAMTPDPAKGGAFMSGGGGGGRGGRGRGGAGSGVAVGGVPAPPPPPAGRLAEHTQAVSIELPEGPANSQDQGAVLRTDFRPLAFWVGSIVTGDDGRASATVTLPDSVTQYRIMAVAGDLASHFGVGDADIRTSLPLTLLPALPRFLAVGNRASFGAVVTNNSATGGTVRVTVANTAVAGAAPLTFEGPSSQSFTLAPGQSMPVRFDARAHAAGQARVRISARLGDHADAFEMPFPIVAPAPLVTVAAYGDTTGRSVESLAVPRDVATAVGGLTMTLSSTALAGLGESARFLDDYPYACAEPLASRALAQLLGADLQGAFGTPGVPRDTLRARAVATLASLSRFRCGDGGYGPFASNCQSSPYLTAYILQVLRTAETLQVPVDRQAMSEALNYLGRQLRAQPPSVQWWPAWGATQAFLVKVLTESGRPQPKALAELYATADRLPVFALSYLADALRASNDSGARYRDVLRRLTNRLRVDADRAFVEELDEAALVWLWHSNVRATAVVLEGLIRRGDSSELVPALARWLTAERATGHWTTTQDHGLALHAMVAYYRALEPDVPQMTVATYLGATPVATTKFEGRSTELQQVTVPMADLAPGTTNELSVERTGTGRVYYTARLQYQPTGLPVPVTRGLRLTRQYSLVSTGASPSAPPATEFRRGDVVRVTVSVWIPHEGRFLAITDPLPAGLEAIDGALQTTARDLARDATRQSSDGSWLDWWRRGGFQHIDKHDDRVVAFATRLAAGHHEFSYLARAMTAGRFETAGTSGEAMYAPEISGRAAAATVIVR